MMLISVDKPAYFSPQRPSTKSKLFSPEPVKNQLRNKFPQLPSQSSMQKYTKRLPPISSAMLQDYQVERQKQVLHVIKKHPETQVVMLNMKPQ